MTKKQLGEEISRNLDILHGSMDSETLLLRLHALDRALILAREYLEKYKTPYVHRFMNKPLQLREPFIQALEEQLRVAYFEYSKDIKI